MSLPIIEESTTDILDIFNSSDLKGINSELMSKNEKKRSKKYLKQAYKGVCIKLVDKLKKYMYALIGYFTLTE